MPVIVTRHRDIRGQRGHLRGIVVGVLSGLTADDWTLPIAPDPAKPTQAYPAYEEKRVLSSLKRCASDLECFNSTALEGEGRANRAYFHVLYRYDTRLWDDQDAPGTDSETAPGTRHSSSLGLRHLPTHLWCRTEGGRCFTLK